MARTHAALSTATPGRMWQVMVGSWSAVSPATRAGSRPCRLARCGGRLLLQQRQQMLLELEGARVVHHAALLARPRERDRDHFANRRCGSVGHHYDSVGEEDRLVDVVRDHQDGLPPAVASPHREELVLQRTL